MARLSRFAWEGFSFEHPEDWSPVVLTGSRRSGYVRLQGPRRLGCQLRWQQGVRATNLAKVLEDYRKRLERDARKSSKAFSFSTEVLGESIRFHHRGEIQGRGFIQATPCGRILLFEAIGGGGDSLMPVLRQSSASLTFFAGEPKEPWSLFGLEVWLPAGLSPAEKVLQSGRTWLTFRPKGARIEARRYAFGEELAAKHGLEAWSRAALRLPDGEAVAGDDQVEISLRKPLRPEIRALVRLDRARNQLSLIRSTSNDPRWRPKWDWLG